MAAEPIPDVPRGSRGDLPSLSVRRPILAMVMNLMIVIAGIAGLLGVEVRELPKVEHPTVTVRVNYPGAAPETMDAEVTRTLEGAAARVRGVTSISAASEEGNARMRLYFDPSVNIDIAANDVREAVAEVERQLPEGVEDVTVVKANDEADPIIQLSVSSVALSREQLTEVIEDQIATALLSIPGVADVSQFGDRGRTLNVIVDPHKLASHRLSIADVSTALQSAHFDVPAGSVKTAEQNLLVRANATVAEPSMIERIVIRDTTRIGDIAYVYYGPAEPTSYVRMNGRPGMSIGVIRQPQSNTIQISERVDETVARLNRQLPDVEIIKTSDDALFIKGAVREVLITLLLAVAIVVTVIMVFIGSARATLIPAVTIPVALIGTVAAIWLLGYSINILTLLALVLATGLVVDDAIVVLENVARMRRLGMQPLAAAILGTRQVFFAVIATTVTLASVFIPIAFLPGTTGALFTEFGFVLAIAVGISSFVALSLCPMLASRVLGDDDGGRTAWPRRSLQAIGKGTAAVYDRTLKASLGAPIVVATLSLAVAGVAVTLYRSLDRELVPDEDRGVVVVRLQGPDGVNLDYSDRQVAAVEALLEPLVASGEVENVLSIIGSWDLHRGYVVAKLAPFDRRRGQHEITDALQPALSAIPGARASLRHPNSLSIRTGGAALEFAVTGPDYQRIALAAETLIAEIERRVPEIVAPLMEYNTTQPELSVVIDRQRASDLSIDIDGIATTLQAMVDGAEVAELNIDDQTVPIVIAARFGAVDDTDDLRNLYVSTRDGRVLPLSSLITLEESGAATELEREAQRRAIEIEASLAPDVPLDVAVGKLEALAAEVLPTGINVVMLGQAAALEETGRDMAITFATALIIVLLVLAAQFESFASAVVVMVTVPFGLAAAVLALWLTGTSLNIYSQIGLVMLVGLMAKNGILIVEFANQLRDQGLEVAEAAHRAAVIRLRPVLMTMLSTTLAGVPLILSAGPGAEARQSIGWVIFGGVGIAIVSTLYITPVVYRLIAPLGRSRGDFGRRLARELQASHDLDMTAPADAARAEHGPQA